MKSAAAVSALIALGVWACESNPVGPGPVASVEVAPGSDTLLVGGLLQLTATVSDAAGNTVTGHSVTWASSNPTVATVNEATGLVTGVAPGQALITASSDGQRGAASIAVGLAFSTVSASLGLYTCGLVPSGAAYCWGANDLGRLGTGPADGPQHCYGYPCSTVPVPVAGGLSFVAVSTGYEHACALTATGTAYCWGYNQFGALGTGPSGGSELCDGYPCSTVPVPVSGGLTFAAVSAAQYYSCGVTTDGVAYCWGMNSDGQLGIGSTTGPDSCAWGSVACSTTPVAVSGGLAFATVSTGAFHSCGLTKDGAGYCWGNNEDGELGDGSTTLRLTPVAVSGGLTFAAVSAGAFDTCGLTPGGILYCWGWNGVGQLGVGTSTGPEICLPGWLDDPCSTVPVPVSGGLLFNSVSVAMEETCGVSTTGSALCWGLNDFGNLGNGSRIGSSLPVPVSGGLDFAAVSASGRHSCGVTASGAGYCWGDNWIGQLGIGSTSGPERCSFGSDFSNACSTVPVWVEGSTAGSAAVQ